MFIFDYLNKIIKSEISQLEAYFISSKSEVVVKPLIKSHQLEWRRCDNG